MAVFVCGVGCLAGLPGIGAAQVPNKLPGQLPPPAQAQQLMQNPSIASKVCQHISGSGMTPDQIRARLRAQGYPDNMLDVCLNSGGGGDLTGGLSDSAYSAITQLGVVDSTDLTLIRCGIDPDSLPADDTLYNGAYGNTGGGVPNDASQPSGSQMVRRQSTRSMMADRCRNVRSDTLTAIMAKARADSGLNIFGLDFFRRQSTQFQPNLSGPVDANYRFGPGDQLVLILTGDVEQSYSLDVTREGFVVIPQVGQIYVNNLTMTQLEDVLYSRLGKVYSGVKRGAGATTRFSVSPARLRSNLIYVTGNVLQPGAYTISSAGTLLSALYAAGGPSDNGSLRGIEVRRGGKLIGTLDFYDYLVHGSTASDLRLQNGDVVFVPVHLPRIRMVGEIIRPATYEIKPTETLADAVQIAGGFTDAASRLRLQIDRVLPPTQQKNGRDRVTMNVVSDALATGNGPALPLLAGDVVHIFRINTTLYDRIVVQGNVNAPGPQGLSPNMMLSDALRLAGGLKPDTYLGQVLISRLQPDSTRIIVRAKLRDTTGAVVNDIPLRENDEIRVFSSTDFRPTRYVAISGAVHHAGQFPYREGMTVRDLVLLAGGLDQSAYLSDARIARLPEDRTAGRTAVEFPISLDSSYLFERGPDGKYLGPPGLPAPAGAAPEVVLKPYDNVLILRQPDWALQQSVVVAGEVRYPGRYTLVTKNERITDLIARAGGFTNQAYEDGVTFYRPQNKVGRIGIDLPKALKDPRFRDNLLLQDGDSILIPRFSALVTVTGAVNSPLSVAYVPGQDMRYYIRAAGGPAAKADEDRAYVTQSNGKVDGIAHRFLVPTHVPIPRPGSTVVVPAKDPTDKPVDMLPIVTTIFGMITSLVTLTIALHK